MRKNLIANKQIDEGYFMYLSIGNNRSRVKHMLRRSQLITIYFVYSINFIETTFENLIRRYMYVYIHVTK